MGDHSIDVKFATIKAHETIIRKLIFQNDAAMSEETVYSLHLLGLSESEYLLSSCVL